jgi:hypothetical protein
VDTATRAARELELAHLAARRVEDALGGAQKEETLPEGE